MQGQKAINKEILALALPAIVSNITTPLLGLVDTAITGHLGARYLGAIAVGGSMMSMAYWVMNFLRMGTSGITAQAYGSNLTAGACSASTPPAYVVLYRSLALGLALSVALIALSPALAALLLAFMDADAATTGLARRYFMIVILGAPPVLATYALSGWFLGMQDSRAPMWMAIVTNVCNIAVSLVLVYGVGLTIEGVATGTVVAQWVGTGVGVAFLHRRYRAFAHLRCSLLPQIADRGELKRLVKVNADIFLRTLCLVAVTLWFTRAGARAGAEVLAANALLMQLFILYSYFMDGFAFAGEALAGKYYGMGSMPRLMQAVRGLMWWGLAVAVLFTAVYGGLGRWALSMLTSDMGVVATASRYMWWAVAIPAAGMLAFAWDGIFIGLTLTRQMLWSIAGAMAAFFVVYVAAYPLMSNHGLWLAFVCYLALRGLIQTAQFRRWLRGRRQTHGTAVGNGE